MVGLQQRLQNFKNIRTIVLKKNPVRLSPLNIKSLTVVYSKKSIAKIMTLDSLIFKLFEWVFSSIGKLSNYIEYTIK